jgi:hypothetical protein
VTFRPLGVGPEFVPPIGDLLLRETVQRRAAMSGLMPCCRLQVAMICP